ncbi:outer membrane lipoprotein carrier protein [Azomonas agilis]|uniref:Outer-membrane lipoprotein carrier protein n=2 Tax=Azomonas agilis TaxID=116849 RepID=A0A562J1W1_9GAMM|nr:outer membrane lipoprotein carrier protein [Azomonas agilis]
MPMAKHSWLLLRALLVPVLVWMGLVHAQAAAPANTSVQKLSELLSRAQTLSGRFSQLSLDSSGTRLQESKGEMSLKRPGQFYWHTDQPMEQVLVSNGEKVWLYDPDLEQVTIRKLDKRLTHTPALLLSGSLANISENFDVSHRETGEIADFTLKPKGKDSMFDSLRLSFRNGVINDMQLVDNVGQRTNIQFSEIKLNPNLPANRFVFEIPKGVDVISE